MATTVIGQYKCVICTRPLRVNDDPLSEDCGGDCWGCVGEIEAECGVATSLQRVADEWRRGLRPNWRPPLGDK